MDPSTMTDPGAMTLAQLVDYAMRGSVVALFAYFFWALKTKVIVFGYQLSDAEKRADKWEALFLDQREIARKGIEVAAKNTGVSP